MVTIFSIAAVAASFLARPSGSKVRIQAEASRIASALRLTRAAAMAQNREMSFIIDPSRGTYASPVIGVAELTSQVQIRLLVARSDRSRSGLGRILFLPSGRSSGGTIAITAENTTARVSVNWATGYAALE